MHGTTKERTISVSSSRPMHSGTHLTDGSQIAGEHRQHGEREHQTRGRHQTAGAAERVDEIGAQPGMNLFDPV
jgi:hypothetical protein